MLFDWISLDQMHVSTVLPPFVMEVQQMLEKEDI